MLKINISKKKDIKHYSLNNSFIFKRTIIYFVYLSLLFSITSFAYNSFKMSIMQSSYITLRIKTSGLQNVIFAGNEIQCGRPLFPFPDEVYINNVKQSRVSSSYNLYSNDIVKLVWEESISNCNCLFYDCEYIKEIDLSNFDSSQVTSTNRIFLGNIGLSKLNLENFSTSKVTDMEAMFAYCPSLTSLDLSGFDTKQVKNMVSMFEGCESLKSIDLSSFDTSNVLNMTSVFLNCKSLYNLNISNFDTSKVEDMCQMFYGFNSLKSIDLSNFDTSKVVNMSLMFYECKSLKHLDLSNFDTSKTENMEGMFYNCDLLESLDLSNFDTSNVNNMNSMFLYCSSLKFLNISSFKTAKVKKMWAMFYACSSLTSLDLSSFDTSNVVDMGYMFSDSLKLRYLNISNFETTKVSNFESMFQNCPNLEYININKVSINTYFYNLNNIFTDTSLNLVVCTDEQKLILKVLENSCAIIDCSEEWKQKQKKINIEDNTCYESCDLLPNHFEYDSKCYKNCESGSYKHLYFDSENNYHIDCISSIEGYYLDEKDSFYKSCYDSCKKCDKEGNVNNHNCLECKDNYYFQSSYLNYFNCYTNCPNYTYFNSNTNHYHCTNSLECPEDYDKLISEKSECVKDCKDDISYKYEYLNKCLVECPHGLINNSFVCENIAINIHDNFTFNLNLMGTNEEIYYENQLDNGFAKFASIKYSQNHLLSNRTKVNLGECENILKDAYNISNETALYIFILDFEEKGMKIPKVEYEVYHKINETNLIKLNLTYCKNQKIEVIIPVNIDVPIDIYNPKSKYYNDICYIYTTNYGTDICLKDRRDEFINNNLSLCEENCDFVDYDYVYQRVKCSCEVKLNFPLIKNVKFDKEKIKKNFIDINNIANLKFLICYKIAFKINNLKLNYAFFILDFTIFLFLICFFLFCLKYYKKYIFEIRKIISALKNEETNSHIKPHLIKSNHIHNKKMKNNEEQNIISSKQDKLIKLKAKPNIKQQKIKKIMKRKNKFSNILKNKNNSKMSSAHSGLNKEKFLPIRAQINSSKNNIMNYNISEFNSLSYEEALQFDKRTFIQYYISLIKINHSLFFSFYPNKDYNSRIIKMFLFFFFFISDFTINALFFSDETIHRIYEDKGSFNFIYQIPQIIYSTIISEIINRIIKYLSLNEDKIIELKEEKRNKSKTLKDKIKNIYTKIKIKFAFFFIICFIILLLFWFYITCFCGIYKNTQIHLIKDSAISFGLSLIYPFVTSLLPGILRIGALKADKKNEKYLYKFSQFLENF